jgi:phage major head subunit gpT-like protein
MAGGSVMNTGGFSKFVAKDFEKIFFDEYLRNPEYFKQVAKVQTESSHFLKEGDAAGLGAFPQVAEGGALPFDAFEQLNEKIVYFPQFKLGVVITEIMHDDDNTGHMKKIMGELGKAAAVTRDLRFWDLLNSGFGTTRTGLDGKALFAADHPIGGSSDPVISGGATTFRNLPATASSFSKTSLIEAMDHFSSLRNARGVPIHMKPDLVIGPPNLKWRFKEIIKSEYDPDNANNTINSVYDEGLQYMICPYLTSSTAWFLASKKDHDLRFIWRKQAAFKTHDDPNTGNAIFMGSMRLQTTFFHWRGIWGNAGA